MGTDSFYVGSINSSYCFNCGISNVADDKMKALILARSRHHFLFLMHHYHLNPNEYKYVLDWDDICGYHWNAPVVLLEGYEYNKKYTVELMARMGHRFNHIGFLSEGEIWENENVPIQYCEAEKYVEGIKTLSFQYFDRT